MQTFSAPGTAHEPETHLRAFVRGLDASGKWDAINVLDLDDASFRRLVVRLLIESGLLIAVREDGAEPAYRERDAIATILGA